MLMISNNPSCVLDIGARRGDARTFEAEGEASGSIEESRRPNFAQSRTRWRFGCLRFFREFSGSIEPPRQQPDKRVCHIKVASNGLSQYVKWYWILHWFV
ncbi:hypothetical protein ABEB36_009163 [Hypothenemus hampei]|uniref:Uncharacterized protein n=1 Tax=Hypothenemus hampei TaxID=57062 RepID=A0ABD1EPC1_HYPHA